MSTDIERYQEQLRVEREAREDLAEKYAALEDRFTKSESLNKQMLQARSQDREQINNLMRIAADAERRIVIDELCEKYSASGIVDKKELYSECLFREGSELDHDAFVKHIETVEKYAAKAKGFSPVGAALPPDGEMPQNLDEEERIEAIQRKFDSDPEKYSAMSDPVAAIEKELFGGE